MIVTWQVDDGYVGNRTKQTEIDDDELNDCETDEERETVISETIQEDFVQRVSWYEVSRRE